MSATEMTVDLRVGKWVVRTNDRDSECELVPGHEEGVRVLIICESPAAADLLAKALQKGATKMLHSVTQVDHG